jgi:hypothetical protein
VEGLQVVMHQLMLEQQTPPISGRGRDGQGLGFGIFLSAPFWLVLTVLVELWPG